MKKIIVTLCFLSLSSSIGAMLGGDRSFEIIQDIKKARREEREENERKKQAIFKNMSIFSSVAVTGVSAWVVYEGFRSTRMARDLENFQWPTKGTLADKNLIARIRTGNRGVLAAGFMGMAVGMKLLSDAIEKKS